MVAIGASTGGPKVLDELLSSLPADFRPAVVVVQHMADGFMPAMVESLRQRCALTIKVAKTGDRLQSGHVLFAPPSAHLTVLTGGRVRIEDSEPVRGFRPSVDVTFASLARNYGARAAGVLLTGMGTDGAAGLLAIRQAGGTTLVQDEDSCVVFGMPRAAIELGAAQHVLAPPRPAPPSACTASTSAHRRLTGRGTMDSDPSGMMAARPSYPMVAEILTGLSRGHAARPDRGHGPTA